MVTYRHVSFAKSGLLEALPFLGAFAGVLLGGFVSDGLLRKGSSLTMARAADYRRHVAFELHRGGMV